jgi:hypothetical protein
MFVLIALEMIQVCMYIYVIFWRHEYVFIIIININTVHINKYIHEYVLLFMNT